MYGRVHKSLYCNDLTPVTPPPKISDAPRTNACLRGQSTSRLPVDSIRPNQNGQHHTTPELRLFSPAVMEALCNVLNSRSDKPVGPSHLRWAARNVCRDVDASSYPIERLLVDLKAEWSIVLDSLHFPRGAERSDVTNRFIGFCIDEYYRPASTEDQNCRGAGLEDRARFNGRSRLRDEISPRPNEVRLHRL